LCKETGTDYRSPREQNEFQSIFTKQIPQERAGSGLLGQGDRLASRLPCPNKKAGGFSCQSHKLQLAKSARFILPALQPAEYED